MGELLSPSAMWGEGREMCWEEGEDHPYRFPVR